MGMGLDRSSRKKKSNFKFCFRFILYAIMIKITFLVMVIVMGAESLTVDEALSKLMPCMQHWMVCRNPAEKRLCGQPNVRKFLIQAPKCAPRCWNQLCQSLKDQVKDVLAPHL